MKAIENELIIFCDVDDTLVMHKDTSVDGEGKIKIKNLITGNGDLYLTPHHKHIDFLKNLSNRGYVVIVWSGNGFAWATHVVKTLGLEKFVSYTMSKSMKFIDDLSAEQVLGKRIYMELEDTNV